MVQILAQKHAVEAEAELHNLICPPDKQVPSERLSDCPIITSRPIRRFKGFYNDLG
jgi:hypothetical protein